jgi:hypothetical protein
VHRTAPFFTQIAALFTHYLGVFQIGRVEVFDRSPDVAPSDGLSETYELRGWPSLVLTEITASICWSAPRDIRASTSAIHRLAVSST